MAYIDKYKITFATKTGKTTYLYLAEDGYSGSLIEYDGVHIDLNYIPTSDDPFEPIYASQLNVAIDITNDLTNAPNLTTLNDRKYNAKLYIDTDLEWQGWVLSDSVQLSYSTGRQQLNFNAVDGLGILQSIQLPISASTNINALNNLLYYVNLCLNQIGLPLNPNLKFVCSYYATGMADRTTHTYSEPFIQTYLPNRTFINGNAYIDCLQVLSNIVKSFGCRVFQAGGKWWIVAVNEFANTGAYFTEYNYSGSVVTSGTINTLSTIQAYTGNTSGLYFIDNSQLKILRKGYNKIQQNISIGMAENYASNGNFRPYVGNNAENWDIGATGTGTSVTIVDNADYDSAQYRLIKGTGGNAFIQIQLAAAGQPASGPYVNGNNVLDISWIFQGQSLGSLPRGVVYLYITDGSSQYNWDGTNWIFNNVTTYMDVPAYSGTSGSDVNTYSFSTAPTPIGGQVFFKYSLEAGTGNYAQISNFKISIKPFASNVNYYAYLVNNNQYVKNVDIPYGYASPETGYAPELGIFLNSTGNYYDEWYEYGTATTYNSLLSLLFQKYMNIFGNNIINIDCSLSSWDTANGYFNASKLIKSDDIDPTVNNVSAYSYMLGNSTINYPSNEINATLLKISNQNVSVTSGHTFTYNTLI